MLSSLLFVIVMEAVTHSVREGLPWEMLYADDLVLVGKYEEELKEKLRKWNECFKDKGLKINEEKTKVMCESFGAGTTQVIGNVKHPCSVYTRNILHEQFDTKQFILACVDTPKECMSF